MLMQCLESFAYRLAAEVAQGRSDHACREIAASEVPAVAALVALALPEPQQRDFLRQLAATPLRLINEG